MSDCEHLQFNSYAYVGRYTDDKSGQLLGFDVLIRLECKDCLQPFHFGRFPRFTDGTRKEVRLTCAPGDAIGEAPWVPGQFECSSCGFHLASNTLNASTGGIAPDRESSPPECPNDGTQMKRITWQQHASDLGIICDRMVKRVLALEDAWPEGCAMPIEEEDLG